MIHQNITIRDVLSRSGVKVPEDLKEKFDCPLCGGIDANLILGEDNDPNDPIFHIFKLQENWKHNYTG